MKFTSNRSVFINNSARRGFTLIELLVVIAIIAILTGIVVTGLTASKSKSRDAQRVSDLNQIQLALEQYFDRCGQYPATGGTDGPSTSPTCNVGGSEVTINSYITKIPKDPSTGAKYDYVVNDATTATDYVLHTTLENANNAQANSFPEITTNKPGWITFSCFDASAGNKNYCISTK
ncbi:MAG: type II secretion system protein [Patescibacteria group bacterium]